MNTQTVTIRLNGATFISRSKESNVANSYMEVTTAYVELVVRHDAAGSKNVSAAGNYSPEFWAQYLGPTP